MSLEGAPVESHDESNGIPGSYRRTLHIIGMALTAGIEGEVDTLVMRDNLAALDAVHERSRATACRGMERLSPGPNADVEPLSTAEASQVRAILENLRPRGLTDIRLMGPAVSTVFITSEATCAMVNSCRGTAAICGGAASRRSCDRSVIS